MRDDCTIYSEADELAIKQLLVGKRIVLAEKGNFELPHTTYSSAAEGKLILDDGTEILVRPNEGCGGCSAGWYQLEHLAKVDNIITSVRLHEEVESGDEEIYEPDRSYRIYVIADNVEINAVQVDGNDGNGYYGSGYELYVFPLKKVEADGSDN